MLTNEDFVRISAWAEKEIGLTLGDNKKYLVEHRLEPVCRMYECSDIGEIIDLLLKDKNKLLKQQVIDSLVTNETYFFRDPESFDDLKEMIKHLHRTKKNKTLRIWSAACSTGQELYSIVITIHELQLDWHGWKIEFVGTDISSQALEKAKKGYYNHFEVQRGLHITQLIKWFEQVGDQWKVNPPFKSNFYWKYANLLDETSKVDKMDIIYLKNVLIYFDNETKKKMLLKMKSFLTDSGYLLLGGTETAFYLSNELARIKEFKTPVYKFKDSLNNDFTAKQSSSEDIVQSAPLKWVENEELRAMTWPKLNK
ncbi:protein-glutamate O-methyltransferase CheR [bacterium]|nr:MAG: protein-glutamate O-methyltransferase CheR [bacterium]